MECKDKQNEAVILISAAEYEAWGVALDTVRLRKRLNEAKSVLKPEYRKMFKPGSFKASERALYSNAPFGYRLKWQTRQNPQLPESCENQQTTAGYVHFERLRGPGEQNETL
jgi:hypothetical protein